MGKKAYEILSSLVLLGALLTLMFLKIYYFAPDNFSYFEYASKAGPTVMAVGGGIFFFLLLGIALVKIVLAFLVDPDSEKGEQIGFALYSAWIVFGLALSMVCFAGESLIAFGLDLGLSLLGLVAFFLDHHFYGLD